MSANNHYRAPGAQVEGASGQQFSNVSVFGVSGRVGRIRYLAYSFTVSLLTLIVVGMVSGGLAAALGQAGGIIAAVLIAIAYLFLFVYSFMITIQRSHDFNTTGWLSLLLFVPIVSLVFLFIPGTEGDNNYGAPPPPNSVGNYIMAFVMPFVMVAVIGILTAIAIPAYNGYIEQSKKMQQQDMQRQLQQEQR